MTYKISELLSDIPECALPLEGAGDVPWERVQELTLDKINRERAKPGQPKRRSSRRIAILAAAALLSVCLTVSAAASGALSSVGELFAAWFGGEPSQIELIERLGQPIGLSDSSNGITISADAILSDGKNFVVLFTASRDNGEPLIPADTEPGGELHFGCTGGNDIEDRIWFNSRMNHFTNEAPGDLSVQFLCYFEIRSGTPDTLSCYFNELEYWLDDGEGPTQVVRLYERDIEPDDPDDPNAWCWCFEIPLPVGGQMAETTPIDNEPFSANGEDFAVTGLRVSPLAVTVDYEVTSTKPSVHAWNIDWYYSDGTKLSTPTYEDEGRDFYENMTLILRKKDGTEIDMSTCVDSLGYVRSLGTVTSDWEQDKYFCKYGGVLPEIVPLEEMDCVIFNGLTYPIG